MTFFNHHPSFFAVVATIVLALFSNGCDVIHSASTQEKSIIPDHPPNRPNLERIPELFIYTNSKITSNYTKAYFYFFDSKKHFSYFSPTENFEDFGYIKNRGNSTAMSSKKPYNIKFEEKQNFFGMGKAKKWVLLSNPFDPTLIRNKLIYDLASNLSFVFSPKSYFIDVWLNNIFMGNYQISEKIEFQGSRIPYDIDKGDFLFELIESEVRNDTNDVYFRTPIDSFRITLKEPENPTPEQTNDFLKKIKSIEKSIATKKFTEYVRYVDLKSIIDYYWIEEFVNDPDLHTGSVFFSIHNGILVSGPVWDFDLSLGNTVSATKASTNNFNAKKLWWEKIFQDSIFQKIAYERYLQIEPYFDNLVNDNKLGTNKIDSILDFFHDSFHRNFSDSGWAYCDTLEINDNQERRQLSCPYNPIPLPTFDENIHFLKEWIIKRNQYLKQTASRKLDELNHIDITLERALVIQDSIFRNKSIF